MMHLNNAYRSKFARDASYGWVFEDSAQPHVYYFSSASPTEPTILQLTHIYNSPLQAFSLDASQVWIWDSGVDNPYIYYLSNGTANPFYWASGLGGVLSQSSFNSIFTESKALQSGLLRKRIARRETDLIGLLAQTEEQISQPFVKSLLHIHSRSLHSMIS